MKHCDVMLGCNIASSGPHKTKQTFPINIAMQRLRAKIFKPLMPTHKEHLPQSDSEGHDRPEWQDPQPQPGSG